MAALKVQPTAHERVQSVQGNSPLRRSVAQGYCKNSDRLPVSLLVGKYLFWYLKE